MSGTDAKAPSAGDTFTLAVDHGEGRGSLVAGSAVEVFDVVDAGTPGTGEASGDKVVIFAVCEPSTILDPETGLPAEGIATRHLARTLTDFLALVA